MTQNVSKFTPGPWELWDGCSWRRFGSNTPGLPLVVEPIVYCERDRHPDLRVSKADAALICAAPDLLAVCIEAIALEESSMATLRGILGADYKPPNIWGDVTDKMRAAIAKAVMTATGE